MRYFFGCGGKNCGAARISGALLRGPPGGLYPKAPVGCVIGQRVIILATGVPDKGRLVVTAHDSEWNVPAGASEFTPVIPDDYTPGRPMMQLGPKK
jgi:hypothetical protein